MKRAIVCLAIIAIVIPHQMIFAADPREEARARGAAFIFMAFQATLKEVGIDVKEILPSYFPGGGRSAQILDYSAICR